jgi:hypothetical protein
MGGRKKNMNRGNPGKRIKRIMHITVKIREKIKMTFAQFIKT